MFRPKLVSVIEAVEGHSLANLQIPVFFVDSLRFGTDVSTQHEIRRFHDFAASMERPVSTNNMKIPDEIFAKIEKRTEQRKVNEQSITIPYTGQETYTVQGPYDKIVRYTEQQPYNATETYSEQVSHVEHKSRESGWWIFSSRHYWDETHYKPENRTRTVVRHQPVEKTRTEVHYNPVQKTRSVTKFRSGVREFWEEIEITKKTFYNGKKDESVRTLRSWTKDV